MSRRFWRVAPISLPEVMPIFLISWPLTGKRGMDHLCSSESSFSSPWYFSSSHTLLWESNSRFCEHMAHIWFQTSRQHFISHEIKVEYDKNNNKNSCPPPNVLETLWGLFWFIWPCLQQPKEKSKQPCDCHDSVSNTSKSCGLTNETAHFVAEHFKMSKRSTTQADKSVQGF